MHGNVIDETGNVYERLKVLGFAGKNKRGKYIWRCECVCGNITNVRGSSLRAGFTKSCGCLRKEIVTKSNLPLGQGAMKLPKGRAALNKLYGNYKRRAKRFGRAFKIPKHVFHMLTKCNCHYCGKEPEQVFSFRSSNGNYIYNGLDRVDNDKGYTVRNVVPCCGSCNKAKNDRPYDEFVLSIERPELLRLKRA